MLRLPAIVAVGAALALARPAASQSVSTPGSPAAEIAWELLGKSAEGRRIEFVQLGSGPLRVLVVGSLAGDQPEGLQLVDRLASHLARFSQRLDQVSVTIVRDPNPDGRVRRTPGNARGIHLDRNFPTSDWHKVPASNHWLSGQQPDSEPETRLLKDLLDDLAPDHLVLLRSAPRGAVLSYAGPARQLAARVALQADVYPQPLTADASGSLAIYAGGDRNIPTLVFSLPGRSRLEDNWSRYKRALLAAVETPSGNPPAATELAGLTRRPRPRTAISPPANTASPSPAASRSAASGPSAEQLVLSYRDLLTPGPVVPLTRPVLLSKPTELSNGGADSDSLAKTRKTRKVPATTASSSAPAGRQSAIAKGTRPSRRVLQPGAQKLPQQPIPLLPEAGSQPH